LFVASHLAAQVEDSLSVDSTQLLFPVDTVPEAAPTMPPSYSLQDSISGTPTDTIPPQPTRDSISGVALDSIPPTFRDSMRKQEQTFELSKDSLDAPVDYSATDSMIYDIAGQKIHLYGNATVTYTDIELKAAKITFNWANNVVTARGMRDSLGRTSGQPEFSDGSQSFVADSMRYNFSSRKGIVYDVTTTQNDVVVHGSRSKFISIAPQDTTEEEQNIIYSQDAIFTTCTADHPHFGIRSTKQKVIPNKLVVVGPSNLEIMDVPTPLWLPFGFFPLSEGRSTGLLFPREYQYSPQWGFGLEGIGWFFPLGDHINLSLTTNLYVKGTWGIQADSRYVKRYKYRGNLNIGYDVRREESLEGEITRPRSFRFAWSHNQDRAAHPTNTFGGSVNIQTNGYQSRVFNDERVLNNQLNSNLSFNKNWRDKPLSFNASFNHSQNTATNQVTVNFPNLRFQTQALYPFKRKERQGKERWYETITFRYQSEAKNRFQTTDTTLFSQKTLEDAEFGLQQSASTGTSFKILKYLNLNPQVNYEEVWYMRTLRKDFDPNLVIETDTVNGVITTDTVSFGQISADKVTGFESFREFDASISLNTQIFGTMQFKKGWLRGFRHTLKPSVSMSFSPDYGAQELNYIKSIPDSSSAEILDYNIFEGGIFGTPPTSGKRMALNYSFNNIFEAKYFSRKDSTEQKFKLFDNIIVNGNYNFAADTLQWSQVRMNGTTRLFKGMTTFRVNATFDPYAVDANGKRFDQFQYRKNGKILRFDNASAAFNTNITVGKLRALLFGQEEEVVEELETEESLEAQQRQQVEETDFLSLFENFRISHNFSLNWEGQPDGSDTLFVRTNTLNCSGSIQLTDNWNINIGNFGYDFVRKGITYPSLGFSRDLHCWQMGANWQPTRGTYSFFIQVKPGTLDFINVPYNRNNIDARPQF